MADSFTTTVITETISYDLDDAKLGAPVAEAIRGDVADGIAAITELARDGKHRLFNRTGALVSGLRLGLSGAEFSILPPADHFTGDGADVQLAKLVSLVPVLQDPTTGPLFAAAVVKSIEDAMRPGPTTTERR